MSHDADTIRGLEMGPRFDFLCNLRRRMSQNFASRGSLGAQEDLARGRRGSSPSGNKGPSHMGAGIDGVHTP